MTTRKADAAPLLVVAAAMVRGDGRVLVQRRPEGKSHAGLWEFPGGKIEPGETPEAALARELHEELGVTIDPASVSAAGFASEPIAGGPIAGGHLLLLLFLVRGWSGEPEALHASAVDWVATADLHALEMPGADRPLIRVIEALA